MADIEPKLCGASTKSGKPCRKTPMKGRDRCRLHGGATPLHQHKGNGHAVRHGIYSRQFSDDELALIPELRETVGTLEDEIILCRLILRRIIDLDGRIESGEVRAGMRLSELRRVTRQREVTTPDGETVMQPEPVEDHMVQKLPDTQELILKYTGRIQNLVGMLNSTHIEQLEALKAQLVTRIGEVEQEKRRLQQFGVIQGGKQA